MPLKNMYSTYVAMYVLSHNQVQGILNCLQINENLLVTICTHAPGMLVRTNIYACMYLHAYAHTNVSEKQYKLRNIDSYN